MPCALGVAAGEAHIGVVCVFMCSELILINNSSSLVSPEYVFMLVVGRRLYCRYR